MKPSEIINKYGWVQGSYGDNKRGYCLMGAIKRAYRGFLSQRQAEEAVCSALGIHACLTGMATWNDEVCKSKRQVLAALRKANQ